MENPKKSLNESIINAIISEIAHMHTKPIDVI
jgi:hypothetical protein